MGLLLLVVPGLFVLVRWSVIVPVIINEERGMRSSFRRSNALVRGHSWTVLWALLIVLVVTAFLETGFDNLLYRLPEFFASWLGHFCVSGDHGAVCRKRPRGHLLPRGRNRAVPFVVVV